MKRNDEILKAFIDGNKASNRNLYTDGNNLINYSTRIAEKRNGFIYISSMRYSITTSKIQNKLRYMVGKGNYMERNMGW